jgi:hypothetical protein
MGSRRSNPTYAPAYLLNGRPLLLGNLTGIRNINGATGLRGHRTRVAISDASFPKAPRESTVRTRAVR